MNTQSLNYLHERLADATEDKRVIKDSILNSRLQLLISVVQLFDDNGNQPTEAQIDDYLKSKLLID